MRTEQRFRLVLAVCSALALVALSCGADRDASEEHLSSGVMLVMSNAADPRSDDEFNRWYDEHVLEVLEVPGVVSATRYLLTEEQLPGGDWPARRYLVIYELRSEDIDAVRERILATSDSRSHSSSLEMDPLPITSIYRQIRETVTR